MRARKRRCGPREDKQQIRHITCSLLDMQSSLQNSRLDTDVGGHAEAKTNLAVTKTEKHAQVSSYKYSHKKQYSVRLKMQMEFGPAATQEFYGYRKIKESDCDYCMTAGDASACRNPCSTWRSVSLIIMMVCFIAATPLSLVLTLPAYILADRVSKNTSHYVSVYVPHMIFTRVY